MQQKCLTVIISEYTCIHVHVQQFYHLLASSSNTQYSSTVSVYIGIAMVVQH